LSWHGRLLVTSVVLLAIYAVVLNVHPFLAVTHRANAKILVVEGWLDEYAIRAGADEFKTGDYEHVITTGGPAAGRGGYTNDYNTFAGVGARRLKAAGVADESVLMVPSHVIGRDRTYSSAIALQRWLRDHTMALRSLNVVTEDVHARRTRFLFQKALGGTVQVGVIAVPNPDYDAGHWWRYSEGVREVIGEAIAYTYARVFFWPGRTGKSEVRDRRTEDRRQKSEDRSQKSEVRSQKSEVRSQKSEDRWISDPIVGHALRLPAIHS